MRLEVDPAHEGGTWDADRATTLGLIATELVTNALKYGAGEVVVRLGGGEADDATVLTVEDAGAGPPPGFDPAVSRGLGMRLLAALLRGGGLEIDRSARPGRTRFVATLPPPQNGNGDGPSR